MKKFETFPLLWPQSSAARKFQTNPAIYTISPSIQNLSENINTKQEKSSNHFTYYHDNVEIEFSFCETNFFPWTLFFLPQMTTPLPLQCFSISSSDKSYSPSPFLNKQIRAFEIYKVPLAPFQHLGCWFLINSLMSPSDSSDSSITAYSSLWEQRN